MMDRDPIYITRKLAINPPRRSRKVRFFRFLAMLLLVACLSVFGWLLGTGIVQPTTGNLATQPLPTAPVTGAQPFQNMNAVRGALLCQGQSGGQACPAAPNTGK